MESQTLGGYSILVVEDEPLITLDITNALEDAGAAVTSTNTLEHALLLAEHDGLSCAILDHSLGDGDCSQLCLLLKARGVPFLICSGYKTISGACEDAMHLEKPAAPSQLVAVVTSLIRSA